MNILFIFKIEERILFMLMKINKRDDYVFKGLSRLISGRGKF